MNRKGLTVNDQRRSPVPLLLDRPYLNSRCAVGSTLSAARNILTVFGVDSQFEVDNQLEALETTEVPPVGGTLTASPPSVAHLLSRPRSGQPPS